MHVHVLDRDLLHALPAMAMQRVEQHCKSARELAGLVQIIPEKPGRLIGSQGVPNAPKPFSPPLGSASSRSMPTHSSTFWQMLETHSPYLMLPGPRKSSLRLSLTVGDSSTVELCHPYEFSLRRPA